MREQFITYMKCKYWRGTNNKCSKGIDYHIFGEQFGILRTIPCFKKNNSQCVCEHQTFYTEAEIDDHIEKTEKIIMESRRVAKKYLAAVFDKPYTKDEVCPICGQRLVVQVGSRAIMLICNSQECISSTYSR